MLFRSPQNPKTPEFLKLIEINYHFNNGIFQELLLNPNVWHRTLSVAKDKKEDWIRKVDAPLVDFLQCQLLSFLCPRHLNYCHLGMKAIISIYV